MLSVRGRRVRPLLAAVVALAVAACGATQQPAEQPRSQTVVLGGGQAAAQQPPAPEVKPVPGFRAPDVAARDVMTREPVTLSSLQGQVVMLNFWATWCGPCRVEMPAMEAFHKESRGKVRILGIGADPAEKPQDLAAFAGALNLTFTIVHDGGEAAMAYRAFGVPTTVFIDQKGIIRARHTGPLTLDQMRKLASDAETTGKQQ